jgi:hypothetical protein
MFDLLLNLVGPPAVGVLAVLGAMWLYEGLHRWLGDPWADLASPQGDAARVSRSGIPLARCTCPFGGLHDGLFVADPSCPEHGERRPA